MKTQDPHAFLDFASRRARLFAAAAVAAAALVFSSYAAPLETNAITGQWDFNDGNLSATIGNPLQYFDGPNGLTSAGTQFGTCTVLGVSLINGEEARIMRVPGNTIRNIGYIMDHGIPPNGGGARVNQFTLIMDVMIATTGPNSVSLLQVSSLTNEDDGDLLWRNDGNFGQGAFGYGGTGAFTAGQWHRVIIACDQAANPPVTTKFVDGIKQDDWTANQELDHPRRTLQPTALLWADGDGDERRECWVNSIQIRSGKMSDQDMIALGGPTAAGIPGADSTPPEIACPQSITRQAASLIGAAVNFTVTATDDTDASPLISCNPGSGSLFPIGNTLVACTARDNSGNSNTCSFFVVVRDLTASPQGGTLTLSWNLLNAILEEADEVAGPWRTVPVAYRPHTVPFNDSSKFYQLRYINGPRLLKIEPSIIAADNASGTDLYIFGVNLDANSRVRVNGQLLTGLTLVESNVVWGMVASLPVGNYDVEAVDPAGTVLAVLQTGLKASKAPALREEDPPTLRIGFDTFSNGSDYDEPGTTTWASVRPASGEFTCAVQDLHIQGRGADLAWSRTYRSRLGPDTVQGNGWDFNYNARVEQAGQNLVVHDGTGRADVYRMQPDGTFACDGFSDVVVKEADGTIKLAKNAPSLGFTLPGLGKLRFTSRTGHHSDGLRMEAGAIEWHEPQIFKGPGRPADSIWTFDVLFVAGNLSGQGDSFINGLFTTTLDLAGNSSERGASLVGAEMFFGSSPWLGNSFTLPTGGGSTGILRPPHNPSDLIVYNGHAGLRDDDWLASTLTTQFHALDGSAVAGKIERVTDANGNAIQFSYDGAGRLATIIDTLNRAITVAYNADGLIGSVTDFMGRQVLYSYYPPGDPNGNPGDLKSVTSPVVTGTSNGNDFPAGKTITYTYSKGFADQRLNHNLLTVTDAKGITVLSNSYASATVETDLNFDRVLRQSTPNSVNPAQQDHTDIFYVQQPPSASNGFVVVKAIVNDRMGNVSEQSFDSRNRLIRHRAYTGRANPAQPTTEAANRPTGKLRASDPNFFETLFAWNGDSLPTQIIYPNSNRVDFIYELDVDPDAKRLARANLRLVRRLPGPLGGDQAELAERFDHTPTVPFSFGPNLKADRLTRFVDARGFATRHTYDARGNCTESRYPVANVLVNREYNPFGQVTAMVHPSNDRGHRRRDEFTYYGSGPQRGYLHEVTEDAGGLALRSAYEYDPVGNLVRYINPEGGDTRYTVNVLNQIVRVQSASVATSNGPVRYERLAWRDANNNLVRVDVQNRDETGAVGANTHFTTFFAYDVLNQRTEIIVEEGNAHLDNAVLSMADIPGPVRGEFWSWEWWDFDANGNPTLFRFGEAVAGNQPDNVVQMAYDERNLPFRQIRTPGSAIQSTTQFDHDGNGNVIRVAQGTEGTACITRLFADGYNRRTSTTDPMGNVLQTSYDANGNAVMRRIMGELADVSGSAGNIRLAETALTYDGMNRLVRCNAAHFDPQTQTHIGDGLFTTTLDYAPNSRVRQVTDDLTNSTVYTYDTASRLRRITDAKGNTRTFTHNSNSCVTASEDVDKSDTGGLNQRFVTGYVRDALDRLTQTTDSAGNVSQAGHDSRNLRVRAIDARGNVTRYNYDGVGRPISVAQELREGGISAGSFVGEVPQGMLWDDSARLIAKIDGNGNTTRYAYDALNRRIVTQMADGTIHQVGSGASWPLGQQAPNLAGFVNGYDVHDNVGTTRDANGTVVTAQFDLNNRVVSRNIAPGAGVSPATTFENNQYDGLSHLVRAEDSDSVAQFSHDSLGNATSESLNGLVTTRSYSGLGNNISISYPSGLAVANSFETLSDLSCLTGNSFLDLWDLSCLAGNSFMDLLDLSTVTAGGQTVASLSHVGRGRVERIDFGNGTRADFSYDGTSDVPNPPGDFGVKQVIGARVTRTIDSAVLDNWTFKFEPADAQQGGQAGFYDWSDMIWSLTTGVEPWNFTSEQKQRANLLNGTTHNYLHDSVERLVSSQTDVSGTPMEQTSYVLDLAGNRVTVTGNVDPGNYTMDATLPEPADRQVNQYTTTGFDARSYDRNGNLIAINAGAPTARTFTYDFRNRLVSHNDAATGGSATYRYDCLNRRIEKTVTPSGQPAVTTRYFFNGRYEIEERDVANIVQAAFIRGAGGAMLAMQRGGETFYFHRDATGNTVALTDSTGAVRERYDYGYFGQPHFIAPNGVEIPSSAVGNLWLFRGLLYDSETGFFHMEGSYFEPRTGRTVNGFNLPSGSCPGGI